MKIGIIGAGAIANFLLKEINSKQMKNLHINSILVRDVEKYRTLESSFGVKLYSNLDDFLQSDIDIVVEAANVQAVKTLLPAVMKKKDVVLISIGALADAELLTEISSLVDEYNHVVHLPSGAIGGLDIVQNAHALGSVTNVTLTTRKPASSLIEEIITDEKVIFAGKAVDAIKQFPKNMNVSIVLALAGLGVEKTNVRLVADPHIEKNIHQVDISGDFGEASIKITNNPFPENPKTSYLAAMSILGTLQRMNRNIRIGG
ncbi:aspartate dehydrogenase [Ornithinibacillus halotolerans]|uniref:L-aspartate dehydrogenase n=1 Tax=Ornithinibacillus halotolerans TaxID=1274357 RepID=A0A916RZD3_9BACI|nr:aspartate dehydrogenase [Ornithinibacillus halotolerans]GGA74997.1 aspartate dehydrogenase [Ornithinibacillus halotolerans]